jgi:uncharacterized damage-inducible protein DinB
MQLERLFAYDDWANREEVPHTRESADALRLLNHIIGAQWLWIARLRSEQPRMAVWPDLKPDQALRELDALRPAWLEILQHDDRARSIDYRNSKGEPWSSRVEEILMHVAMHGTYHRGQIATLIRQAGRTPAYTDFIHAARTGAV